MGQQGGGIGSQRNRCSRIPEPRVYLQPLGFSGHRCTRRMHVKLSTIAVGCGKLNAISYPTLSSIITPSGSYRSSPLDFEIGTAMANRPNVLSAPLRGFC